MSKIYADGIEQITDHASHHAPGADDELTKLRQVKRNLNGTVQFASAGSSRGTSTAVTGGVNPSLTTSLTTPANFIQAIATLQGWTNAANFTAGSVKVQVLDGTSALGTTALNCTAITGTKTTLTTTLNNVNASTPVVKCTNNAVAGTTINTVTIKNLLNDLQTITIA